MIPFDLDAIEPSDIQRLIENQVEESISLEYKQELPSDSTDARREFLYDVAAFANSRGGHLIYGISDQKDSGGQSTGLPDRIIGIPQSNPQRDISRLENIVRDGITPRVEVNFKLVGLSEGLVLVVQVPESWSSPHMVIYQKTNKFYTRSNSAKELMSLDNIRSSFMRKRELRDRIADWRNHRLDLIERGDSPVPLRSPIALVIHVLAADFFSDSFAPMSWVFPRDKRSALHIPGERGGSYPLYNADGFLHHTYIQRGNNLPYREGASAYTQVFRYGALEYVNASIAFLHSRIANQWLISIQEVEETLVECFANVVSHGPEFGISSPAYFAVSLLNWSKTKFYRENFIYLDELPTIQNDRFLIPELLIDSQAGPSPFSSALRPIADMIAQVGGLQTSPSVDHEGNWLPLR